MPWHTAHYHFLSVSSKVSVIIYTTPAILLAVCFGYFEATREYIIPALLVYLIAALTDILTYGFQAVCVQIKVVTDYALEQQNQKSTE